MFSTVKQSCSRKDVWIQQNRPCDRFHNAQELLCRNRWLCRRLFDSRSVERSHGRSWPPAASGRQSCQVALIAPASALWLVHPAPSKSPHLSLIITTIEWHHSTVESQDSSKMAHRHSYFVNSDGFFFKYLLQFLVLNCQLQSRINTTLTDLLLQTGTCALEVKTVIFVFFVPG